MKGITLLDGLFKWKQSRVYVSKGKLHMKVMQEVHDAPMVGHHGEKTTKELLGKTIYWPEMKEDIEHYVCTCVKGQSTKLIHKKMFGLYRPFLIPSGPFESFSMDFMTCFLEWEGTNAIFVVVDMFLKLVKFVPT